MKPFSIERVPLESAPTDTAQVRIAGFLDAHTVISFEKTMEDLLKHNFARIILDLSELTYISSAGIGALMVLLQQLRRRNGDMVIMKPSEKVYKVLELLGFTRIFHIADDQEGALRSIE